MFKGRLFFGLAVLAFAYSGVVQAYSNESVAPLNALMGRTVLTFNSRGEEVYGKLISIFDIWNFFSHPGIYIQTQEGEKRFVPLLEAKSDHEIYRVYQGEGCNLHNVCIGDTRMFWGSKDGVLHSEVQVQILGHDLYHADYSVGRVLADAGPFKKGQLTYGVSSANSNSVNGARIGSIVSFKPAIKDGYSKAGIGTVTSVFDFLELDGEPAQLVVVDGYELFGPYARTEFQVLPANGLPIYKATEQAAVDLKLVRAPTKGMESCAFAWSYETHPAVKARTILEVEQMYAITLKALGDGAPQACSQTPGSSEKSGEKAVWCPIRGSSATLYYTWHATADESAIIQLCLQK